MRQGLAMNNLILGLLLGCILGMIFGEFKSCDGEYNWDNGVCYEIE